MFSEYLFDFQARGHEGKYDFNLFFLIESVNQPNIHFVHQIKTKEQLGIFMSRNSFQRLERACFRCWKCIYYILHLWPAGNLTLPHVRPPIPPTPMTSA